jgi:hypothetical protein
VTNLTRRSLIASAAAAVTLDTAIAKTASGRYRSFHPGEVWLDTAGKPIQAHAGSIMQIGDFYYWYGENKEFTTGKTNVRSWGVRCYKSADLYNWDDLGLIIPPDTEHRDSPLHPTAALDRPHILYNAETKKYVCWIKLLWGAHQTRTVLVADAITGPYRIVRTNVMPVGMGAGDFDLVTCPDDGKAYMYFERVHSELICADLTPDYTDFTGYYSTHFPRSGPPFVREAPAYFKRHGKHYMATSGTTSYFPNPTEIAVADTYHGPFTLLGDMHPSDRSRTSFNTQISSVFKHPKKKDLYIALGDVWIGPRNDASFLSGEASRLVQSAYEKKFATPRQPLTPEEQAAQPPSPLNTSLARYSWLPIRFDGDRPVIDWRAEWSLDEFA